MTLRHYCAVAILENTIGTGGRYEPISLGKENKHAATGKELDAGETHIAMKRPAPYILTQNGNEALIRKITHKELQGLLD